jgi:two-component system, OmpR family, response regulator
MRLLVVEDEIDLARTLKKALEEEHFAVDVAADGEEALSLAQAIPYGTIVLDLMLPRIDGTRIVDTLRSAGSRTPILILTARDTLEDKVGALARGADDYLTKPFSLVELVARVRALIRRSSVDPSPIIVIGDVAIDTAARVVRRGGRPVALTAREYAIVELLARRRGTLVTRPMLEEHLYSESEDVFSNVVDVHIAALRRKLGPALIATRRGHGYIIDG